MGMVDLACTQMTLERISRLCQIQLSTPVVLEHQRTSVDTSRHMDTGTASTGHLQFIINCLHSSVTDRGTHVYSHAASYDRFV